MWSSCSLYSDKGTFFDLPSFQLIYKWILLLLFCILECCTNGTVHVYEHVYIGMHMRSCICACVQSLSAQFCPALLDLYFVYILYYYWRIIECLNLFSDLSAEKMFTMNHCRQEKAATGNKIRISCTSQSAYEQTLNMRHSDWLKLHGWLESLNPLLLTPILVSAWTEISSTSCIQSKAV